MRIRPTHLTECADEFLRQIAGIIGSKSAASRALEERDRRREAGEDAVILWDRDSGRLLVGPRQEAA